MPPKYNQETCTPDRIDPQHHESAKVGQTPSGFHQTPSSHMNSHGHDPEKPEFINQDPSSVIAKAAQFIRELPSNLNSVSVAESVTNSTLPIKPVSISIPSTPCGDVHFYSVNTPVADSYTPSPLPTGEIALQSVDSSLSTMKLKKSKSSKLPPPILPTPPTQPPPALPITSAIPATVKYPLGHFFVPPDYHPHPNEPQLTITAFNAQIARTFLGSMAIRLVNVYRDSGFDIRRHELKGPWQIGGGQRWQIDMPDDWREEVLERMLWNLRATFLEEKKARLSGPKTMEDLKSFSELTGSEKEGLREKTRGMRPKDEGNAQQHRNAWPVEEWLREQIELIARSPFSNRTWCYVRYHPTWCGAHESTMPLQPRQRPLRPGCSSDGFIWEDEKDETNCTSYCHVAPVGEIIGVYESHEQEYRRKLGQARWSTFADGRNEDGDTIYDLHPGTIRSNPNNEEEILDKELEAFDAYANEISDLMSEWWEDIEETIEGLQWYADVEMGRRTTQGRMELQWLIAQTQAMMMAESDDAEDAPSGDDEVGGDDQKLSILGKTDTTEAVSGPSQVKGRNQANDRKQDFRDMMSK
ncbi:hypothetical protein ACMFMG_003517 [Clarireedia jacksonii]